MQKLDNKNRLTIPKFYYDTSDCDNSKDVRLFQLGNAMFIGNYSLDTNRFSCLGKIHIDKKRRFVVPKLAREVLHLKAGDAIICYVSYGRTTFLKSTLKIHHK